MAASMLFRRLQPWRLCDSLSAEHRAGLFGIGWSGLAQLATLSIRLASNLILTRLLAPEVYGLLGSALAVLTTLEWLSDLGIQPALVRHPQGMTPDFLSTGWSMGISRGVGISILASVLAWPLALLYRQPEWAGVLLVLALRPFLMALRSPGIPVLRRGLHYRALFIDEVAQTAVGTVVALLLALWLHSVWAVVGGTLAGAVTAVVVSYLLTPFRPRWNWDPSAATGIYELGHQVFFNTLVMALLLSLPQLLGLRFVDAVEFGYYTVAFTLATVAESLLTRGCDVYFAMLSRMKDGPGRLAWHRTISHRVALLGMPMGALLVLLGPLVIRQLYDPRYAPAGVLFAVLIARLMLRVFGQVQFQLLLVTAQVRLATRAYVVAVVVQVACLFAFVPYWGVLGLALSVFVTTLVLTVTQTAYLRRITGDSEWGGFFQTAGWASLALVLVLCLYS